MSTFKPAFARDALKRSLMDVKVVAGLCSLTKFFLRGEPVIELVNPETLTASLLLNRGLALISVQDHQFRYRIIDADAPLLLVAFQLFLFLLQLVLISDLGVIHKMVFPQSCRVLQLT